MQDINNGRNYVSKMDNAMTKAMTDWWNNLTKDELLAYISEQPTMTADVIRAMMGNMNCVLAFDIRYSAADSNAVTDFHTNTKQN